MRFLWVLALCGGVWAQNTVLGTGSGSGTAVEGRGSGSGITYIGWPKVLAPSISFGANLLGGVEGIISNPNSGTTVSCLTMDGTTPATNGDGKTCAAGFASLLPALGGGYFAMAQPATVKIISGVAGQGDSAVSTYNVTVPKPTIQVTNFGGQCALGVKNCGNPLTWPTSPAMPKVLRMHDAQTWWSALQPTSTNDWVSTYLDEYLDLLAANGAVGIEQFTTVPKWDVANQGTCQTFGTYAPYGCTDPPMDLTASGSPTFNAFVSKFVQYCNANGHCVKDLVKVFQLSNEYSLTIHWTGTAQQLYWMLAPAAGIIRANVPNVVIGGASVTSGKSSFLQTWLNLENAQGRISDVADFHSYIAGMSPHTPEYQWTNDITQQLSVINGTAGWSKSPFIDGETGFSTSSFACDVSGSLAALSVANGGSGYAVGDFFNVSGGTGGSGAVVQVGSGGVAQYVQVQTIGSGYSSGVAATTAISGSGDNNLTVNVTQGPYSETDCASQPARWQLIHASNGAVGVWWYYIDYTILKGPTAPTSYSTIYGNLQPMLIGGYFTAAASSNGLNPATWSAPFIEASGTAALWLWTDNEGGISYTVPAGYVDYRDLFGNTIPVTTGQSLAVGNVPILLEQ